MGNDASKRCCCGKGLHIRTAHPVAGERCHFWIPHAGSLIGVPTFTVYDASVADRTAWLSLAPSGSSLDADKGSVGLHNVLRDRGGEPLVSVALSAWTVRRLGEQEQQRHLSSWTSESYGYQYAWEASRTLSAHRPSGARRDDAPEPTELVAKVCVSHFGVAGSTNTPEALADLFAGEVDVEVAAAAKEHRCTTELRGAPMALVWDVAPDRGLCSLRSSQPDFNASFERGDVRIQVAGGERGADALLLCALGFCTVQWAAPWNAECIVADSTEEAVLREIRSGIAAEIGGGL